MNAIYFVIIVNKIIIPRMVRSAKTRRPGRHGGRPGRQARKEGWSRDQLQLAPEINCYGVGRTDSQSLADDAFIVGIRSLSPPICCRFLVRIENLARFHWITCSIRDRELAAKMASPL
jgi:hypothetical protein